MSAHYPPGLVPAVPTAPVAEASEPPAPAAPRRPSRWWGALLPAGSLLLLELTVRLGAVPAHLLPPPSEIARTLVELSANGLGAHVLASTVRVFAGFATGALLAIGLGVLVGLDRRAKALLDPSFQALRAIPSLAWVPLLLLWLGIDEGSKIVLIAIGAFFPVYMGVASGFRDVDRKLVEVAEMAGLSPLAMARRVLLPAALPALLTGLRNGLSLAWMFMVAAELIAATRGLGYLLTDGRETGRADIVLAAIVLLAVMGKLTDTGMQRLEARWLSWRDTLDTRA
ncbi:ABC transporter permease [Variovorax sp. LjRoot84]|uniref:ABC transporter permease n=1 Tax=unclassified Variovorax TaxID=663243 RepID=UPI003ECF4946